MELINLLKDKNWDEAAGFSEKEIQHAMQKKITNSIKKLYQTYYRGLLLNFAFVLLFIGIYLFNQTIEFLVPVLIISSCFAFIFTNLLVNLASKKRVDPTHNLKTVISDTLAFNEKIHRKQCQYNSIILTISFLGGFLLGLAFQGWTIAKFIDKPIIFPVLLILTIGFYFTTKTKSFEKLNKWLNPGYHRAKKYLTEQLELIKKDE